MVMRFHDSASSVESPERPPTNAWSAVRARSSASGSTCPEVRSNMAATRPLRRSVPRFPSALPFLRAVTRPWTPATGLAVHTDEAARPHSRERTLARAQAPITWSPSERGPASRRPARCSLVSRRPCHPDGSLSRARSGNGYVVALNPACRCLRVDCDTVIVWRYPVPPSGQKRTQLCRSIVGSLR